MNRFSAITIACFVVLAVSAYTVSAAPSFRGYSGLVKIPNADTLNLGQWNVGVMTEDVSEFDANDIFANYGIADNLEVGFNAFQRLHSEGGKASRQTILNAKYAFSPETEAKPGIAVGITDITNAVDTTPYVVLSKSLGKCLTLWNGEITNFRGHIGLGGGQFDGVFVGFSAFLGNRVSLMFEWDSRDPNFGVRFTPIPDLRIQGGWFDVGGRDDIGVGMSYTKAY